MISQQSHHAENFAQTAFTVASSYEFAQSEFLKVAHRDSTQTQTQKQYHFAI